MGRVFHPEFLPKSLKSNNQTIAMTHKSADQIQAEIRLMRLAYQEREERHECLNRYLGRVSPLSIAAPYLISLGTVIGIAVLLIGAFF